MLPKFTDEFLSDMFTIAGVEARLKAGKTLTPWEWQFLSAEIRATEEAQETIRHSKLEDLASNAARTLVEQSRYLDRLAGKAKYLYSVFLAKKKATGKVDKEERAAFTTIQKMLLEEQFRRSQKGRAA